MSFFITYLCFSLNSEAESTMNESETEWERSYWKENISPILQALEAEQQGKMGFVRILKIE